MSINVGRAAFSPPPCIYAELKILFSAGCRHPALRFLLENLLFQWFRTFLFSCIFNATEKEVSPYLLPNLFGKVQHITFSMGTHLFCGFATIAGMSRFYLQKPFLSLHSHLRDGDTPVLLLRRNRTFRYS